MQEVLCVLVCMGIIYGLLYFLITESDKEPKDSLPEESDCEEDKAEIIKSEAIGLDVNQEDSEVDSEEKIEMHEETEKVGNPIRKIILILTGIFVLFLALYPPWVSVSRYEGRIRKIYEEGRHSIFYSSNDRDEWRVKYGIMASQVLVIGVGGSLLSLLFRKKQKRQHVQIYGDRRRWGSVCIAGIIWFVLGVVGLAIRQGLEANIFYWFGMLLGAFILGLITMWILDLMRYVWRSMD